MSAATKKNSPSAAKSGNSPHLLAFVGLNAIIWLTVVTNLLLAAFLSFISRDILWEFFKLVQFLAFLILLLYLSQKLNKIAAFFFLFFFYFIYLALGAYYFLTHTKLDFAFLARNINNLKIIISSYWLAWLLFLVLAAANTLGFYCLAQKTLPQKAPKRSKLKLIFAAGGLILISLFFLPKNLQANNNELIYFAKSIFQRSAIIDAYQNYYQKLIQKNIKSKTDLLDRTPDIKNKKLPAYLDNIIILHLESLNGFLVNKTNTPTLLSLSKGGIFIPYLYGNGVQTIMGQESILCSLPGSFDLKLYDLGADKKIICLPVFLRAAGYRNYFFTGGHLFSDHTENFMRNIGFTEIHNKDIMRKADPEYAWGYREDIFYQRVFSYLKKHQTKRNFIYIDVGATHHWPFNVPADYRGPVPYPRPGNFKERFANTLFIQDHYLKTAWQEINKLWPKKNYTVLILGDHSWPADFHPGNTFNEKGAYEENFRTALVMIFGNEKKFQNLVIKEKFSQMDIMPSLLDLMGITLPPSNIRRSFMPTIISTDAPIADHLIILVQPYEQRYLSIIRGDDKFLYNAALNQFIKYNLKTDPNEQKGEIIGRRSEQNLKIFNSLLNSN